PVKRRLRDRCRAAARAILRFVGTKLTRFAALGAVSLGLAGCTPLGGFIHNGYKVGPNYGRPPADTPPDWIDGNDVRIRKDSPDLSRWWTVLKDPVLDDLVQSAYRQNLTLREAGFRVLQARAAVGIAVGELFPQKQDAFGDYTRNVLSKKT